MRRVRMGTPWLSGLHGFAEKAFVTSSRAVTSTTATLTHSGDIMVIYMAIGTATSSSVASIPASAVVVKTTVIVETPYSGGATIDVGYTGSISALASSANKDTIPTVAGSYDSAQPVVWGGSTLPVLVTIGGAPGAGAGHVVVEYVVPQS